MRKTSLPELLLAGLTTPDRAAAIMGDLEELAAPRTRIWFWTTYARTLVTLGWRTPVAFAAAIASVMVMCRIYPAWVQYQLHHLKAGWQVNMFFGQLAIASGPFLNSIAMCLWFALPFAWMRFGRRDRLTQFACVLFFSTLGVFSFRTWLIDASSVATMLVILAALLSARWRRPLAVLAFTFITAIASVGACIRILAMSQGRPFLTFSPGRPAGWLSTAFALGLAAFVCSYLHRLLLRPSPVIA